MDKWSKVERLRPNLPENTQICEKTSVSRYQVNHMQIFARSLVKRSFAGYSKESFPKERRMTTTERKSKTSVGRTLYRQRDLKPALTKTAARDGALLWPRALAAALTASDCPL